MRAISKRCERRAEIATDWWQQSTRTFGAGVQATQADAADIQIVNLQVRSAGGNQRILRVGVRF